MTIVSWILGGVALLALLVLAAVGVLAIYIAQGLANGGR